VTEALIICSNLLVGMATIHLAHRSLPEHRRHWLKAKLRCCYDFALVKAKVKPPYRGAHRGPYA
jgi:hypothetical protein